MIQNKKISIYFNCDLIFNLINHEKFDLLEPIFIHYKISNIKLKGKKYSIHDFIEKLREKKYHARDFIGSISSFLSNLIHDFTKKELNLGEDFSGEKIFQSPLEYFFFFKRNYESPYFFFIETPENYDLARYNYIISIPNMTINDFYLLRETGLKVRFSSIKNLDLDVRYSSYYEPETIYFDEVQPTPNFFKITTFDYLSKSSNVSWSFDLIYNNREQLNFEHLVSNKSIHWNYKMLFVFKRELSKPCINNNTNKETHLINKCIFHNKIHCTKFIIEEYKNIIDFSTIATSAILDEKTILTYSEKWNEIKYYRWQQKTSDGWEFGKNKYILWELLKWNNSIKWTEKLNSLYEDAIKNKQ